MATATTEPQKGSRPFYKSEQYNKAVGDWLLGMNWSHWCTLTTPYELTLKGARRLSHRFHKRLNMNVPAKMFWAAEPFDVKEGHHIHALLSVPNGLPYQAIIETYQKVAGSKGWSRIDLDEFQRDWKGKGKEEREEGTGATYYVSKYITKRLSDYDLLLPRKARKQLKLSLD